MIIDKLPDNLTNWVFEAVVSASGNRVGIGSANVGTRKPIMVVSNLPRFFVFGDTITLAPSVINESGKDGYIRINIETTNGKFENMSERIFLKNHESKSVPFLLRIADEKKENSP